MLEPATPSTAPAAGPEQCTSCGKCRGHCAVLSRYGTPAQALAGPRALAFAYACSLCGLCRELCPQQVDTAAAARALRRSAFAGSRHPRRRWFGKRLYEGLGRVAPFRRHLIPPGAETVLFPGCALAGTRPQAVLRLWQQLRATGSGVGLVLDCCSALSRNLGNEGGFRRHAERLTRSLQERGVTRILLACPTCHDALHAAGLPFRMEPVYAALDALPQGTPGEPTRYTVHDPCSARRYPEWQTAARRALGGSGAQLIDLPYTRATTLCCGAEGDPQLAPPRQRADAFSAAPAPMATYCASCVQQLERLSPVRHVLDVLYGGPLPQRPAGLLRQFWRRWRLARAARRRLASPSP